MKGTIRILVGLVLLMGGVGGIEQSMELFPLYPTLIAFFGLFLFGSGALAAARQEQERGY